MLDSHPHVAVPPETYFVSELASKAPHYEASSGFRTDAFLRDILGNQFFRRWGLPVEAVSKALLADPPADYADGIRRLYALWASTQGKRRYGDKTPVYVYDLRTLAELFPEARFVHLIRDGRDVACSFLDQEDMRPNGVAEAALLWKERVSGGRSAGAELGPGRYMELRYEELVGDAEAVLRRLCEFLDLGYDPAMLTYTERASGLVAIDGGPRRHRGLFLEPQIGLRDWRTDLSGDAVEAFELIAGDLLAELGYERRTDTRWAEQHAVVWHLVDEIERLRGEIVTEEKNLRRRIRILRRKIRKATPS